MKNLWKKLIEMAVVAIAPIIIELVKEQLDALKKKIENKEA